MYVQNHAGHTNLTREHTRKSRAIKVPLVKNMIYDEFMQLMQTIHAIQISLSKKCMSESSNICPVLETVVCNRKHALDISEYTETAPTLANIYASVFSYSSQRR